MPEKNRQIDLGIARCVLTEILEVILDPHQMSVIRVQDLIDLGQVDMSHQIGPHQGIRIGIIHLHVTLLVIDRPVAIDIALLGGMVVEITPQTDIRADIHLDLGGDNSEDIGANGGQGVGETPEVVTKMGAKTISTVIITVGGKIPHNDAIIASRKTISWRTVNCSSNS